MCLQAFTVRLIACLIVIGLSAPHLVGQATPSSAPPGRAVFEIDLRTLLDQSLAGQRLEDSLWEVRPRDGFTAIQVPIVLTLPDADVNLDANTLKMGGGKFVAWRFELSPESQRQPQARTTTTRTVTRTQAAEPGRGGDAISVVRGQAEEGRLGTGLLPTALQGQAQTVDPQPAQTVVTVTEEPLTEQQIAAAMNMDPDKGVTVVVAGAPMMATRLTYHGDGTFRWNLDRRIVNAAVKQTPENPYALLLDRQLLMSLNPALRNRERQSQSGQRVRMTAEQRQQQKQLQTAYNELKKRITKLPTGFRRYHPDQVWGIYIIRNQARELTLSGMQSGNWQLNLAEFEQAARLARSASRNSDDLDLSLLQTLVKRRAAYDLRLGATVLAMGGYCELAEESEAVNQLLENYLATDDSQAKLLLTEALIAVRQPTGVTARLLGIAAGDRDKQVQLTALGGLLAMNLRDDSEAKAVVDAINTLLTDPQGLPVDQILATTIDAAATGGSRKQDQLARYLQLASQGDDPAVWDRTKQAIDYIAATAHTQPLAADWLDHKLLGSGEEKIIRATLQSLAAPAAADQTIMITRANHYLLDALESDDPSIRRLGWQASRRFTLDSRSVTERSRDEDESAGGQTIYQRLVAAAVLDDPSPQEAAALLGKDHTDPATRALIEIAVQGHGNGALAAAGVLVGGDRRSTLIFESFTADQRQVFGRRLYQQVYQVDTAVVGLLRVEDRTMNVSKWFAEVMDRGPLPQPHQWVAGLENNPGLVARTGDSDEQIALGALTALVVSEGGTEDDARRWHQQFATATNRTQVGLASLWLRAQAELRFQALEQAQGEYQMVIQVMHEARRSRRGRDNPVDQMPVQGFTVRRGGRNQGQVRLPSDDEFADATQIEPGIVSLKCDPSLQRVWLENLDLRMKLATGVTAPIALQLASPGELVKLPSREIGSYSFEKVTGPVDLLLYPDASWRGTFLFDGGKAVRVSLLPR